MRLSEHPLIGAEQIALRVTQLGEQISCDFAGKHLVLLVVLKGGILFAADLMRRLAVPVVLEFIRVRSYEGMESTRSVDFLQLPEGALTGKHVLILEDISDTGHSAAAVKEWVQAQHPASSALCVLLDKPSRRECPLIPEYVGFTIEDHFAVGYGLDYEQAYRELPAVYVMEEEGVSRGETR